MSNNQLRYNSVDGWVQIIEQGEVCDTCGKKLTGIFFKKDGGSECLPCIIGECSRIAVEEMYHSPDGMKIMEAFDYKTAPPIKIGMLVNMKTLLPIVERLDGSAIEEVFSGIVSTLGYNSDHPLSRLLRHIAIPVIIAQENKFLPILISLAENNLSRIIVEDSLFLNYNLALTLSYIAPYNKWTKQLIRTMLGVAGKRKDLYVTDWFVNKEGYYFPREDIFSPRYTHVLEKIIINYGIAKKLVGSSGSSNNYKVKQILNEIYTAQHLKTIYGLYLKGVYKKAGKALLLEKGAKKQDYIRAFSKIIQDLDLAEIFLQELPVWFRKIFEEVVWEDKCLLLEEFIVKGGLKVSKKDERYSYSYKPVLPPESQLFQIWISSRYYGSDRKIFLYFDDALLLLFRTFLPKPDSCRLSFKDACRKDLMISRNPDILKNLTILMVYMQQFGLKKSKNGLKILKSTIKDVIKLCNIEEIYPHIKRLENLRTSMTLELLEKLIKVKKGSTKLSSENLIKSLFTFYFSPGEGSVDNFSHYLDYLKFRYSVNNESLDELCSLERTAIQILLDQMEVGKWVSIDNIQRYFNGENIMPLPFSPYLDEDDMYFNVKYAESYMSSFDRMNVSEANRGEVLYKPYLKVLMFVLNTLGVLDIAYTRPVNKIFQNKNNPWLSVYDGIKEVSLTSLGAWLTGKADTYDKIESEPSAVVVLDDKRLIITVQGSDPILDLTLTTLSVSLGPGCYEVSAESFLHGCESELDIKEKIKRFKTNICAAPPEVWEAFFNSMLKKVNPLKHKKGDILLFQLDPKNKELIQLLFQDAYLRSHIVKAENYHIIIKESSYNTIQKRLAVFGYLLPPKKNYQQY